MSDNVLQARLKAINKELNLNVRKMTEEGESITVETVSSGSLAIDQATGRGGWARGRITEIYGTEGGGKTTVSLCAIASVQKQGGKALFIDAEHSIDPEWARKLGVNVDELYIEQPNSGENALELVCQVCDAFDIIVVDSVSSLIPLAELEGSLEESKSMGIHARMMSQSLRKVSNRVGKSKCIVIFINQIRLKPTTMGNPEYTTGGQALKFYASIRVDVRKIGGSERKNDADEVTGHDIRVKFVKNKIAAPFKEAIVSLDFTKGFDEINDILVTANAKGVFTQAGAWVYLAEDKERKWNGWEKLKEALKSDNDLRDFIRSKI